MVWSDVESEMAYLVLQQGPRLLDHRPPDIDAYSAILRELVVDVRAELMVGDIGREAVAVSVWRSLGMNGS